MKTETLDEYLTRGGEVKKLPAAPASAPDYNGSGQLLPKETYGWDYYKKKIRIDEDGLD